MRNEGGDNNVEVTNPSHYTPNFRMHKALGYLPIRIDKEEPMFLNYRNLGVILASLFVLGMAIDSVANVWVQKTELPTSRLGCATAVVNGKIYIIGGSIYNNKSGPTYSALSTVAVYDTRTNTWHKAADMPTPRIAAQAAVVSGDIYVLGGYNEIKVRGEKYKKIVEVYHTRTDTWMRQPDMPTRRSNFEVSAVGGKIYAIGGEVFNKQLGMRVSTDIVEAYDPVTERWRKRVNMPTKRHRFDTPVVNGKIYAIGGEITPIAGGGLAERFITTIEVYNPKTDRWRKLPDMPMFKFAFSTVGIDKEIYTIGGHSLNNGTQRLASVDVYDPVLNRWRAIPPMPTAKTTVAAAVNGTIYVLGGFITSTRFSPTVEAFDTGFRAVNPKGKLSTRWGKLKKSD